MKHILNPQNSNIASENEKYCSHQNEEANQNDQRNQPTHLKQISFYLNKNYSKNDNCQKNMEYAKKDVQSSSLRIEKQGYNQYGRWMNLKNHQMRIQNITDEDLQAFALLILVMFLFTLALYLAPNQFYNPQK